jgi:hypothetical protein
MSLKLGGAMAKDVQIEIPLGFSAGTFSLASLLAPFTSLLFPSFHPPAQTLLPLVLLTLSASIDCLGIGKMTLRRRESVLP